MSESCSTLKECPNTRHDLLLGHPFRVLFLCAPHRGYSPCSHAPVTERRHLRRLDHTELSVGATGRHKVAPTASAMDHRRKTYPETFYRCFTTGRHGDRPLRRTDGRKIRRRFGRFQGQQRGVNLKKLHFDEAKYR